jgi:hypothetical protein
MSIASVSSLISLLYSNIQQGIVEVLEVIENPELAVGMSFLVGSDVVRRFLEAVASAFGLNKV